MRRSPSDLISKAIQCRGMQVSPHAEPYLTRHPPHAGAASPQVFLGLLLHAPKTLSVHTLPMQFMLAKRIQQFLDKLAALGPMPSALEAPPTSPAVKKSKRQQQQRQRQDGAEDDSDEAEHEEVVAPTAAAATADAAAPEQRPQPAAQAMEVEGGAATAAPAVPAGGEGAAPVRDAGTGALHGTALAGQEEGATPGGGASPTMGDGGEGGAPAAAAAAEGAAKEAAEVVVVEKEPAELSLEWLRDATDQRAAEFLMSVAGLGRKSTG